MGQSAIKNPRRIVVLPGGGGTDPALEARVEYLEDNTYKITYFAEINGTTGTITKPTNSTILTDQFFGGVDAYVSTIQNGQPTGIFPQTAGGVAVDVTSFNTAGDFVLNGTPSAYPVALIYKLSIAAINWQNLDQDYVLDMEITDTQIGLIINGATDYPTPLDADKIGIWNVANSLFKALTWANLKATLKTYFDTLYSSGSLYIPNVWISPNFTTKVTGSSWTGTAWFVPFFVAKQTTITELGIEVTTGVAASTIRIGLFSADSSGNVGTLIDQTGTMSSVSTGVKSTIISQSIASGLYYLGFQSSAAGVSVRQGNVVSNINEIGGTGAAVLRSTLAYGPFSSNPTVTFTAQTNAPYLLFKTS